MRLINNSFLWKFVFILAIGQVLSVLLTGIGVFATLLHDHTGKDVSSTLTAGAFFILSATVGSYVAYKPGFVDKIKQHWWKFIFLGLADVYGTYLQNVAFKYISVVSNQVITSSTCTLFIIILATIVIKTRYKLIHYVAIIIGTLGMVLLLLQDIKENKDQGSNPQVGDLLCVAAGISFAIMNVGSEFFLKGRLSLLDTLGFLSFCGAVVTGIQVCILDRVTLVEMKWDLPAVLYFTGYHACNIGYYFFFLAIIQQSSSMIVSLSLLTTNVYSLIFAIFLFDNKFSVFYIGGFVVIMFGLILYNIISVPEGGTDQSVFSIGYWYNYRHLLFCEWRCCPPKYDRLVDLSDDGVNKKIQYNNSHSDVINT
ncbi:solute carrier family 35 member F1-like [Dysidea avara]|uniref:solute carrier family 35 member F1-like n=1 Tax=Dysidea avara TaxID=196820 RepID=UPI00332AA3AF